MKMNYEQAMEIVDSLRCDEWAQFRKCQAYYSMPKQTSKGTFVLFKSYRTIVALVDIDNQVLYRLGKWSTTTSKQTTQFHTAYYPMYEQVQF